MKLSKLAAKPQLIKISIDDAETVERYGEALEFCIYDRQDMDTFVKLASADSEDFAVLAELVRKLILDDDGKPVITNETVLPMDLMMKAIQKVIESLGKPPATILTTPAKA